jgi:hypothetical protein
VPDPPWTIGVHGEWGSGKTPFLRLVEKAQLTGWTRGTVVVSFEAGEPVSIMVGSRFGSELGRGVVTRIVK